MNKPCHFQFIAVIIVVVVVYIQFVCHWSLCVYV